MPFSLASICSDDTLLSQFCLIKSTMSSIDLSVMSSGNAYRAFPEIRVEIKSLSLCWLVSSVTVFKNLTLSTKADNLSQSPSNGNRIDDASFASKAIISEIGTIMGMGFVAILLFVTCLM